MHRAVRSLAVLTAALVVGPQLAASAATTGSWSPPVQLSAPIPPTDVVGDPAVAVNGTGAEVAAWYDQAADGTQLVHIRTSADGRNWSAPTNSGPFALTAAPGHAALLWIAGGATVSNEPIS
jgi:hypothetical protein